MGLTTTHHISTIRTFKITRLRALPSSQRTLWWWAKRSRSWFNEDEDQERAHRHQAIMLHRYSKALKRRALWDRDNAPRYPWRLRSYSHKLEREISSTRPGRAKVEEQEEKKEPWQEMHDNFESFKKAVDKAIARDPYGTLFGRRLRSPDTNAGWTSWSWIFDPKEIKDEGKKVEEAKAPEPEKMEKMQETVTHTNTSSKTTSSVGKSFVFSSGSISTTEYVYDPISGRKIPQQQAQAQGGLVEEPKQAEPSKTPPKTETIVKPTVNFTASRPTPPKPEKSLLQQVFGENGVEIPVKTYKAPNPIKQEPTKVEILPESIRKSRLHEAVRARKTIAAQPADKQTATKENSRTREYNELRWRTIGNNIDATNFNCEPWNNKSAEEPVETEQATSQDRENAPLFSGTTYASRSEELTPKPTPSKPVEPIPKPSFKSWLEREGFGERQGMTMPHLKTEATPKPAEPSKRMEPALDRTRSDAVEVPVKKFGVKMQPSIDRVTTPASGSVKSVPTSPKPSVVKSIAEDKREDIDLLRASDVRAAAKAARTTKQEIEQRKREERAALEKDFTARQSIDRKPESPKAGNLTAAMSGSMDHVWDHIKDNPNGIVARTMKSFGVKPEPVKNKPANVSTATTQSSTSDDQKLQRLAKELNMIHKSATPTQIEVSRPKPSFLEPTVKPGVTSNLAIEKHTKVFEPKLAAIVDGAKEVTKSLREAERQVTAIEVARTARIIPAESPVTSLQATPTPAPTEPKIIPVKASEQAQPTPSAAELKSLSKEGNRRVRYEQHRTSVSADNLSKSNTKFVRIRFNPTINEVVMIDAAHPSATGRTTITSIDQAFKILQRPDAYLKPLMVLSATGYTFVSGTPEDLIFKAPKKVEPTPAPASPLVGSIKTVDTIAAEEAAAQPPPKIVAQPVSRSTESSSVSEPTASASRGPSVSRQEHVFSGTRLPPHTTALPDPEHFQKQTPVARTYTPQSEGFFSRLRRVVKRVVLTTLALGAGAYGLGVIAEGMQSRTQVKDGVDGPMKRLVMEKKERD